MNRALKGAVYDGYIDLNPAYEIENNAGVASQSEEDKFINYNDFIKIRDYVITRDNLSYFVIYLLCVTGARFSEAVKINLDNIDLERNYIHIRGTKTKTSDRYVTVSKSDIDFIVKRLNMLPEEDPLKISNNAVTKAFRHAIKEQRIDREKLTFHALQHTHCSILLSDGIDLHYVSERLGHTSLAVTLRVYSHLLEERRTIEETKVENYLEEMWSK